MIVKEQRKTKSGDGVRNIKLSEYIWKGILHRHVYKIPKLIKHKHYVFVLGKLPFLPLGLAL